MKSKNKKVLDGFVKYCRQNPDQRFWQALANYGLFQQVRVLKEYKDVMSEDTFYFEGLHK